MFCVNGRAKSWAADEHDPQFGENDSIDTGKSQRLRKEGNARINILSAMRSGLAKMIVKVHISWYFESPQKDLHMAENAPGIMYTDTWSLKWLDWMSTSESPHCSTSDYGCEDTLELHTGAARARLPITGLHMWVASTPIMQWIPATLQNSRLMDNCQVCHGRIAAMLILDPLDVKEAYSHIASHYHSAKWHVRSHGEHHVSFGQAPDTMEGRLVLRCEVSSTEVVKILQWSDSNNGHVCYFHTHSRSFPEVAII